MKKKICWARVIKNICYFCIPIVIVSFIISILCVSYVLDKGTTSIEEESYFDTKQFAQDYFTYINNTIYKISDLETYEDIDTKELIRSSIGYNEYQNINLNNKEGTIFYEQTSSSFKYLIIDNKNNIVYTNSEYGISYNNGLDELIGDILPNELYWSLENGEVSTSIKKMTENRIKESTSYYTIYTAIEDELPHYDYFFEQDMLYKIVRQQYNSAKYNIPIDIILLILMINFVFIGIGKTAKQEDIYLNWFDKIHIEWVILLVVILGILGCMLTFGIGTNITAIVSVISIVVGIIFIYILAIILLETIVKRLKTHTFVKNTFAYFLYSKLKVVMQNLDLSLKVIFLVVGFGIGNCIGFFTFYDHPFIGFIILSAIYIALLVYLLKKAIHIDKIRKAIKQIYMGDSQVKLNDNDFTGLEKETVKEINDIAGGLSNAIDEKMKSERLKTELITNVSHDIKTPLTSIINYVDLLKKEGITSEKAEEYLAILDNKSQRLKKLTEDLVEASKASSGNIKLNMENIEVNELMKQVSAEFADKFKEHNLQEEITFTNDKIYIKADSRYIYRAIENLYSNVSKYAMENSRVYVDIIEHGNNVIIQIKNISKEKLNISTDELMQRFVRGDTSRNTEGSGLGLSIANSLIELQGGKFHIYLDGDLFKVTIGFQKV